MSLTYDPEDGQVFTENTTCEFSISKWLLKSKKSGARLRAYRNSGGAASLQDMVMRSILLDLPKLDSDALRSLPWDPFGQKLWDRICTARLVSVTVWKRFVTAYGWKLKPLCHYRTSNLFENQLSPAVPYISAPNLEWLTILTISDYFLDLSEWMQIGTIPNLTALAVYERIVMNSLNARVMRAWADHTQHRGAFPKLELFVLNSYQSPSFRQSPDCLEYLAFLPKLQAIHIDVTPTTGNDAQQQTNWLSKETNTRPSHSPVRTALYELLESWRGDSTINGGSNDEKPVLDVFHGRFGQWVSDCACDGECRAWYQRTHNNPEAPNDRPVPDSRSQTRDASKASGHKRHVKARMKRSLADMLGGF